MKIQELEQVIRDYLMHIYHKKYIGKIEIEKLDPVGYSIKLGMNTPLQPKTIHIELEDEKFLKVLKQELKDMKLNMVQYGGVQLTYHTPCQPINSSCSCHDKE